MSEPCVKSDKIERLEKDVIDIKKEHKDDVSNIVERLNRHSDKIDKISDNNLVLETILKRLEEDGKEQKTVNAEMQKTMVSIQGAMSEITFNVRELNSKLAETDQKVSEVNTKVNKVDEKTKFDFADFIKTKVIPALLTGGCIYGIAKFIESIVK